MLKIQVLRKKKIFPDRWQPSFGNWKKYVYSFEI